MFPFRFVITSLHISSILTCPSSVSWLYIIFHMKTNIYLVSSFKNLAHENKNLHSNVFSKLSATLHTVLPASTPPTPKFAPPTPNLFHPHQICSTHSKFIPPAHFQTSGSCFYIKSIQNKNTKVFFWPNANKYPHQIFSTSTPLLILHITPPTHIQY